MSHLSQSQLQTNAIAVCGSRIHLQQNIPQEDFSHCHHKWVKCHHNITYLNIRLIHRLTGLLIGLVRQYFTGEMSQKNSDQVFSLFPPQQIGILQVGHKMKKLLFCSLKLDYLLFVKFTLQHQDLHFNSVLFAFNLAPQMTLLYHILVFINTQAFTKFKWIRWPQVDHC